MKVKKIKKLKKLNLKEDEFFSLWYLKIVNDI